MRRLLGRLRAALDAQYDRELNHLRERHTWLKDYDVQAPIRGWYAVHKPTGTTIGPARSIKALDRLILANPQPAQVRPRPATFLPHGLTEEEFKDRTQLDVWDTWPERADGQRPPQSAA